MWCLQYWDSLLHSFQFALKEVGPCHEVLKGKLPLARNQTPPEMWRNWPLSVCTLSSKDCITATELSKCFLSMCQLIAVLCGFNFFQVFFISELISSKDWARLVTGKVMRLFLRSFLRLRTGYAGKESIIFSMMALEYMGHY